MWIELQDMDGNLIDEPFEIEDELFDRLETLAKAEGKPVEDLLLEAVTSYAQVILDNDTDET